jgi:hypothetical protein
MPGKAQREACGIDAACRNVSITDAVEPVTMSRDPWNQRRWKPDRRSSPQDEIDLRPGASALLSLTPSLAADRFGCTGSPDVGVFAASARGHRVIVLVAAILVLGAFDLALTLTTDSIGILHEYNPVARFVMAHGVWAIVLYKVGLHVAGAFGLVSARFRRSSELAALFGFALYAGLAAWWGLYLDHYAYAPLCLADAPAASGV